LCVSIDKLRCVVHVLTLKQPWAWAVLFAGKDVENRPAATHVRGRVLVHAGLKLDRQALAQLRADGHTVPDELPGGLILGSVEIVGVTRDHPSKWAIPGHSHWLLARPEVIDVPIPHRGLPWLHRRKEPM
jgi:hypothetical protein